MKVINSSSQSQELGKDGIFQSLSTQSNDHNGTHLTSSRSHYQENGRERDNEPGTQPESWGTHSTTESCALQVLPLVLPPMAIPHPTELVNCGIILNSAIQTLPRPPQWFFLKSLCLAWAFREKPPKTINHGLTCSSPLAFLQLLRQRMRS